MSRYRRALLEGGTFFFTVTLADRSSDLLVRHIDRLRRIYAIRYDADLERHIDYIHFNPVKHGLVSRVCDWPHSSFKQYVERGDLPPDWGGDVRNPAAGEYGE